MALRKKLFIMSFALFIILVFCILYYQMNNRNKLRNHQKRNTIYALKCNTKFIIPNLTKVNVHRITDRYAVSFAVSDSIIYIVDSTDSTNTKSYSYDFNGKTQNNFMLPYNTGYWKPLNDNCFYYLPTSNQLAYLDVYKLNLDFYNLQGKFIKRMHKKGKDKECYLDVAEFEKNRYYSTISYPHNKKDKNIILNVFEERTGNGQKRICKIIMNDTKKDYGIIFKLLQLDNYSKDMMAILVDKPGKCVITLYTPDKTINIAVPKQLIDKNNKKEYETTYQFFLGNNFIILGSLANGGDYPLKYMIYDLKGRKVGKLAFKDDPKNELVDIVSDKLVAFNPATSTISIYQIKVQ